MKTQRAVTSNGKVEKRVKLIEDYWNTLDPKPEMTFKQFETICKTPFQHVRKKLSQEVLYEIRFKYLGMFFPVPSTVVWMLGNLKDRFRKGLIDKTMKEKRTQAMIDYITKNPEPFKRFKEILKPWIEL